MSIPASFKPNSNPPVRKTRPLPTQNTNQGASKIFIKVEEDLSMSHALLGSATNPPRRSNMNGIEQRLLARDEAELDFWARVGQENPQLRPDFRVRALSRMLPHSLLWAGAKVYGNSSRRWQ
ncbi:hypothetical protein BKA70DRAFT_1223203 [Coprinopsis sp. MPI-PUGE-AT-0042]|nr:hypothetical protein BKA70DRAFT_1223203 [Coprinopsis sp. MPI-PUGE-AT-0042]